MKQNWVVFSIIASLLACNAILLGLFLTKDTTQIAIVVSSNAPNTSTVAPPNTSTVAPQTTSTHAAGPLPLVAPEAVRGCTQDTDCFDLPVGNSDLAWSPEPLLVAAGGSAEEVRFGYRTAKFLDALSVTAWLDAPGLQLPVLPSEHRSTSCEPRGRAAETESGVCVVLPLRRLWRLWRENGGSVDLALSPNCTATLEGRDGQYEGEKGISARFAAGSSPLCALAVSHAQVSGAPYLNAAVRAFLWEKQAPQEPGDGNVTITSEHAIATAYRWAALFFDDPENPLYPSAEPDWAACSQDTSSPAVPACVLFPLDQGDFDFSAYPWTCDGLHYNASSRVLTGGETCLPPQLHVFATEATNRYSGSCSNETCSCLVPGSLLYPHWYYQGFDFGNPEGSGAVRSRPDCSLDLCWEDGNGRCDYETTYCRPDDDSLVAECRCLNGYDDENEGPDGVIRCQEKNECLNEDLEFCPFNEGFVERSAWHFVGTAFTEYQYWFDDSDSDRDPDFSRPIGEPLPLSTKTLAIALWAGERTSSERNTEGSSGWPRGDQQNFKVQFGTTRCSHSALPLAREVRELEGACFYEPLSFLDGTARDNQNTLRFNADTDDPRPLSTISPCEVYFQLATRQLWLVDKSGRESCAVAVYRSELESEGNVCTNEEGSFSCSAGCPEGSSPDEEGVCVCPDFIEQPLERNGVYRGQGYSLESAEAAWSGEGVYTRSYGPLSPENWLLECSAPEAQGIQAAVESGFWQFCMDRCKPEYGCHGINVGVLGYEGGGCYRACQVVNAVHSEPVLDEPGGWQSVAAYRVWPQACATARPPALLKPLYCPSFQEEGLPPTFLLDLSDISVADGEVPTLGHWLEQERTDRVWQFQTPPTQNQSFIMELLELLEFSGEQLVGQSNQPGFFESPLYNSLAALLTLFFRGNANESAYWPALDLPSPTNFSKFYLEAGDNEEYWEALIEGKRDNIPVSEYSNLTHDPGYWGTEIARPGMYTFRYSSDSEEPLVGGEGECGFNLLVVESKAAGERCAEGFLEERSAAANKSWCNCFDTCGNWVEGRLCEGWGLDSAVDLFDLVNCVSDSDTDGVKSLVFPKVGDTIGSNWSFTSKVDSSIFEDIVFHGVCLPLNTTESLFVALVERYTLEASLALVHPARPDAGVGGGALPAFDISNEAFHVFTNYSDSNFYGIFAEWLGSGLPTFSEAAGEDWSLDITVRATDSVTNQTSTDSCTVAFRLPCPDSTNKAQAVSGDGNRTFTYCACASGEAYNQPFFYGQEIFAFNLRVAFGEPHSGWNLSVSDYEEQDLGCGDTFPVEEGLRLCLQSCAADPDCVGVNFGYPTNATKTSCTPACGKALAGAHALVDSGLEGWTEGRAYEVLRDNTDEICVIG